MMNIFYFDTSIWLDFYEKRGKNGEAALRLIVKIIKEGGIILYSDVIIKELEKLGYLSNEVIEIFSIAKPEHIKMVQVHKRQIEEAERLALLRDIPKRDSLHAIIAKDNEANLITRDYHFQKLKDIIVSKLPEDYL